MQQDLFQDYCARKSTHPLKGDLLLCIFDLLDEGDDDDHESKQWIEAVDRGGNTYYMFVSMESELRRHISGFKPPDQKCIKRAILSDEDVLFFWSIISSDWEEESATALLEMVVREWTKIRGFSLANAWIERYKVAHKQTTQKSKGLRKQLISKPKANKSASTTDKIVPCKTTHPPSPEEEFMSEINAIDLDFD